MDAISKIDRAHRKEAKKSGAELDNDVLNSISGQLSLRKEYFDPSGIPNSDSVGVDVTCHQIQYGIKLGIFAFTDDSDYDEVAALSYYIEFGDEVDEKDMTQVIEEYTPPSALARQVPVATCWSALCFFYILYTHPCVVRQTARCQPLASRERGLTHCRVRNSASAPCRSSTQKATIRGKA